VSIDWSEADSGSTALAEFAQMHDEHHETDGAECRARIAWMILAAVSAFYLWTEHRARLLCALPQWQRSSGVLANSASGGEQRANNYLRAITYRR